MNGPDLKGKHMGFAMIEPCMNRKVTRLSLDMSSKEPEYRKNPDGQYRLDTQGSNEDYY